MTPDDLSSVRARRRSVIPKTVQGKRLMDDIDILLRRIDDLELTLASRESMRADFAKVVAERDEARNAARSAIGHIHSEIRDEDDRQRFIDWGWEDLLRKWSRGPATSNCSAGAGANEPAAVRKVRENVACSSDGSDDPETDGADAADPAWWRGVEHGTKSVVKAVSDAFYDRPIPGKFANRALQGLCDRIRVIVVRQNEANGAAFVDGYMTGPHAFIQWKGTSVCADIWCGCGEHGHVDDDFMYYVRCPKCGATYEVGCHMPLRPADVEDLRKRGVADSVIKTWDSESDLSEVASSPGGTGCSPRTSAATSGERDGATLGRSDLSPSPLACRLRDEWSTFRAGLSREPEYEAYALAYWLCRHSGWSVQPPAEVDSDWAACAEPHGITSKEEQ